MVIVYALIAATAFGVSDYLGGALSRKESAESVNASTQAISSIFYLALALFMPGEFSWHAIGFGVLSGLATAFGLFLLYKTLAEGVVGVVASTAAICSALIPATWGFIRGDTFSNYLGIGIAVAILAVFFLTREENHESQTRSMTPKLWFLTLLAGILLSSSTVALSNTVTSEGFWPLVGLSLGSVPAAILLARSRKQKVFASKSSLGVIVGISLLISIAYFGQLNAVRHEVLAVASVVGALYPLPTMLLARVVDHEKLTLAQKAGAVLSLVAIGIIALG